MIFYWSFWEILWDNGLVFKEAGDSSYEWPMIHFQEVAKRLKYTNFVKDQSLIGGYFTNAVGDCLVCLPYGSDPSSF